MGSQIEKMKKRLLSEPTDYTFNEAKKLLENMGFIEHTKGKTSGSRIMFIKGSFKILLHKPHPGNEMKKYAVRLLKDYLVSIGEL